jgi:hypothetical protein
MHVDMQMMEIQRQLNNVSATFVQVCSLQDRSTQEAAAAAALLAVQGILAVSQGIRSTLQRQQAGAASQVVQ